MQTEQSWMDCLLSSGGGDTKVDTIMKFWEKLQILNKNRMLPLLLPTSLALKNKAFPLFKKKKPKKHLFFF